jgi:hypothetical protein
MIQYTLDNFKDFICILEPLNDGMILVSIMKDFNASWYDRDWYFHAQDIVHVPGDLAALLINRGIARKISINRQSKSIILQDGNRLPESEKR